MFWSDVSVFLRPVTLVSVAVLPRLVVIIPLTLPIASVFGQKNNKPLIFCHLLQYAELIKIFLMATIHNLFAIIQTGNTTAIEIS